MGLRGILAADLMLVSADLTTRQFIVIKARMATLLLSCMHSGMHMSMAEAQR